MAGKKGRSGGARPGAGRKPKTAVVQQACRRDTVLAVVHDEVWRQTVTEWIQTARETKNFGLLFPLLPYILGGRAAAEGSTESGSTFTIRVETVDNRPAKPEIRVLEAG